MYTRVTLHLKSQNLRCDTPCGKFEFLGNVQYKDGTVAKDFLMFDPGVFNDNGRIFMYYGFNRFGNELPLEEQGPFHEKTMEEIVDFQVKLKVEGSLAKTWYDCK